MRDHLALFREFADLERKRTRAGVTPLEYQRWLDLKERLGSRFERSSEAGEDARSTRMCVEFQTPEHFRDSYMPELARGGVFVNTPFAPAMGTELVLVAEIVALGLRFELAGVVASNNVSDGFSTDLLGMGVHFRKLEPETRFALDELLAKAGPSERKRRPPGARGA